MASPEPPPEVIEHYESVDEGQRLVAGRGRLELARTREIVRRHLPPGRLRILDVGGGTGIHAEWLAADGHDVHLVDPVPCHVARAAQVAGQGVITAEIGDARQLAYPDASFDAVLMAGPLYHLTDRSDRIRALTEARRVLRPGGLVFAAAVSRFASLFDGLARGFLFDPAFAAIVRRDLAEGQHRNPTERPEWWTTAYLHHPDELNDELESAGLVVLEVLGVEGMASWLEHLDRLWDDTSARETIIAAAREIEAEPSLLGLSAHLLAVAERPAA